MIKLEKKIILKNNKKTTWVAPRQIVKPATRIVKPR